MKHLTLGTANGKSFTMPIEAVTQTFGILAKKGQGKSYCASVFAEELLKAGQQIVAIDPTGAWHGLRSSADGKREGFSVVVFGGDRASLDLKETAGEIIANAIVEHRFSAVLDLSLLRKGAANRFVGIFLETLYRLNREPLHLFVDEADAFAPQRSMGDEARTLGAMEDIVRRGRIRGIGCTLISQRPQVLNKNVLTQVETLVVGNLSHPKDIGAIEEWIDVHADPDETATMVKSLPSLTKPEKWVWSPGWLNCFSKIVVRARETFDSGATPKPGQKVVQPKKIAAVDIQRLGKQIADLEEQRKAEDPKELKRKIADLEKQVLAKTRTVTATPKPVLDKKSIDRAVAARDKFWQGELSKAKSVFDKAMRNLTDSRNRINDVLGYEWPKTASVPDSVSVVPNSYKASNPVAKATETPYQKPERTTAHGTAQAGEQLPKAERKILTVLAQRHPRTTGKIQLAVMTEYKHSGGGFKNALGALRSRAFVVGSDQIEITDDGLMALGEYSPLPTGLDLVEYWLPQFGKAERAILSAVRDAYPESISKTDLATQAGYEVNGGGFKNALGKLRTYELIQGSADIKLSDNLFD